MNKGGETEEEQKQFSEHTYSRNRETLKFFTPQTSLCSINTKAEQHRKYKLLSTNRAFLVSFVALASMSEQVQKSLQDSLKLMKEKNKR